MDLVTGRIGPEGITPVNTLDMDVNGPLVLNQAETLENKRAVYYAENDQGRERLEERKDYGVLTEDENVFNLDDIILPPSYVVTGVRFNYKKVDEGPSPIQLEVRATLYDFFTGNLVIDEENSSIWLTSTEMKGKIPEYDRERRKINIPLNTNPTTATGKFDWIYDSNYFVEVGYDAKAQLILPLVYGGVPMYAFQTMALGGVGLSYEAYDGQTAGFLFLRVYEFDWVRALQFPDLESAFDNVGEDEDAKDEDENENRDSEEDDDD